MNKNKKLLKDFAEYCEEHPELRFWQSLRNWSGLPSILALEGTMDGESIKGLLRDTFYWEEKDK